MAALEAKVEALWPSPEEVCQPLDSTHLREILRGEISDEEERELCRTIRKPFQDLQEAARRCLFKRAKDENPEAFKRVSELTAALWRSQFQGTFTTEKMLETYQKVYAILASPDGASTEAALLEDDHGAGGERPVPSTQIDPQGKTLVKRRCRGADDAGGARQGTD